MKIEYFKSYYIFFSLDDLFLVFCKKLRSLLGYCFWRLSVFFDYVRVRFCFGFYIFFGIVVVFCMLELRRDNYY